MNKLDSIQATLKIADDWQRKGQPTWVSKCLATVLMGHLSIAVTDLAEPETGKTWLREHGVSEILKRYLGTLQELIAKVETGELPSSVIAGNYHSLVYAHLAWCLEDNDLAKRFIVFSNRRDVCVLSTKFWCEYARAMEALVEGHH